MCSVYGAWQKQDTNIKIGQGNYTTKAEHHSIAADSVSKTCKTDYGQLGWNVWWFTTKREGDEWITEVAHRW